jgi:asparagine synthase (glutamine-hydrolysing)
VATERGHEADLPDFLERMMFPDTVSYLPDDILAKVDRAGMGVSLDSRIPLLDHRLVEFAWRLPLNLKMRHGQGKCLLKQVLPRIIPPWQGSTQVFGNERINRF